MSDQNGLRIAPGVAAAAAVGLLALGAVGMYVWQQPGLDRRPGTAGRSESGSMADMPARPGPAEPSGPVRVRLTDEAVARAGIRVEPVRLGRPARSVRVPGVVEPNGYASVVVTALGAGQVTNVTAELGQHVVPGQVMAEIYSPELAQAEREYVAARAELLAIRQRVARLERLTIIGAASEQELEQQQAEATRAAAEVEGAGARLQLLGLTAADINGLERAEHISAAMPVPATSAGIVTERMANRGQNVTASSKLFTVVDLSSVWVVGDVYERDLGLARIGSEVAVTAASVPGRTWRGRVSYVDPQIAMSTRTARVRVEVDNPGERLTPGMFADLTIQESATVDVVLVARTAVQTIGATDVVYVPDPADAGVFLERPVRLGRAAGEMIEVLAGLGAGETVVTAGSFSLRAERDRLGLPPPRPPPSTTADEAVSLVESPAVRRYTVTITDEGLSPTTVRIPADTPVAMVFVRRTENTCGTDVVLPDLGIERNLPLNQEVVVELGPQPAGELAFACGVGMLRGTIVVVSGGER